MSLTLKASDVSGQKIVEVSEVQPGVSVGELVTGLVTRMRLPRNDSSGRPLHYQLLNERLGKHLQSTARLGDEVQDRDSVVLQPNVDAGAIAATRSE